MMRRSTMREISDLCARAVIVFALLLAVGACTTILPVGEVRCQKFPDGTVKCETRTDWPSPSVPASER